MLGLSGRAARYTWTAALVLLGLETAYLIRGTLFILVIAILFAHLLYPLVDFLNRHIPNRSRTPALAIVYLALVAILVVLVVEIGSQAADQAAAFTQSAPAFLAKLKQQPPNQALPGAVQSFQQQAIGTVESYATKHYNEFVSFVPKITLEVLKASTNLIYLIIIPVLSFFILKDGRTMKDEIVSLIDHGSSRILTDEIFSDVHTMLLQYMRALVSLSTITLVVFAIALSLLGVPYAILLASIAFPLEFVPLIGPLVAATIIIGVTLLSGYPHVLWIVAFLGAYRLCQDYIISPRLMSSGVELHPLLVILGVFAGGEIAGVEGSFLSLPVLALCRVVYKRIRLWSISRGEIALAK